MTSRLGQSFALDIVLRSRGKAKLVERPHYMHEGGQHQSDRLRGHFRSSVKVWNDNTWKVEGYKNTLARLGMRLAAATRSSAARVDVLLVVEAGRRTLTSPFHDTGAVPEPGTEEDCGHGESVPSISRPGRLPSAPFAFEKSPSFRLTTMNWLPLKRVRNKRPMFSAAHRRSVSTRRPSQSP